ncbi:MAG: adenylosuccinate lyase, partial [Candidatus Pacebacteria bacterium]|nr:adenylosuccinate lyase [Candidatus Paceibacterota bacterium]
TPALENVALWHERDISHSSVERAFAPDATITLDFALMRATRLVERLVVYPETMKANLEQAGGLIHSQQVLLELTRKGMSREDAYKAVQRNAMKAWAKEGRFRDLLAADDGVTKYLSSADLDRVFDLDQHRRYVDHIFARVFGKRG